MEFRFFELPRRTNWLKKIRVFTKSGVKLQCSTEGWKQLLSHRKVKKNEALRSHNSTTLLGNTNYYHLQLGTDGQHAHLLPFRLLFLLTQEVISLLWLTVNKNRNLLWLYCYLIKPTLIIQHNFQSTTSTCTDMW